MQSTLRGMKHLLLIKEKYFHRYKRGVCEIGAERIVEQLQIAFFDASEKGTVRGNLHFSQPVKEILILAKPNNPNIEIEFRARLIVNGHDFCNLDKQISEISYRNIYGKDLQPNTLFHSFSISNEGMIGYGTLNCSRIDSMVIAIQHELFDGTFKIYATNFNVIRFLSGMAGLAYGG